MGFCSENKERIEELIGLAKNGTEDIFGAIGAKKDELMKRIDTIMAESRMYLQPGLKITDVSGALCSNRTYVSNTINSVTGMTFNEYINRLRIDHAVKLFNESPDICCIECAERCGFTSKSTFFRVFKEYTGRTPSSWRTS